MYNAAYTPELGPIEFSFSKLKNQVKKAGPISGDDLVVKILQACGQVTNKECAEYIIHSLTFIKKAINKEDFY